jgi:hypothetical protein
MEESCGKQRSREQTIIIHVGTNDLRQNVNLDYVMGDVYALVNVAKTKFLQFKLILSGTLRSREVTWHGIKELNSRYDWTVKTLGVTLIDPNSWIENWDIGKDGFGFKKIGARRLSHLYSRVCGFGSRPNSNE